MEQARMRRRGTAVLLDFWLPQTPEGRRQVEPGRTLRSGPRTDAGTHRGAHAVEFSKTAAPLLWRGLLRVRLPGRPRGLPSGQQMIARPPGVSNPREAPPVTAAARDC